MNRASRYIHKFLHNHPGLYENRQEIRFFMTGNGSMIVYALFRELPLEKCLIFGITYTSTNFDRFIQDFGFVSIKQLKALSAGHLWEMYYNGQAAIYCVIAMKEDFVLNFRRQGNKMIVYDQSDNQCELSELLQTPEQIAAYTRQQAFLHASRHSTDNYQHCN